DQAFEPAFQVPVAGEAWLLADGDGVDVRRVGRERQADVAPVGLVLKLGQEVTSTVGAAGLQHRFERIEPLFGFSGIDVGGFGAARRRRTAVEASVASRRRSVYARFEFLYAIAGHNCCSPVVPLPYYVILSATLSWDRWSGRRQPT